MKTKIYSVFLIFTMVLVSCNLKTKVNEPSKSLDFFKLTAKQVEGKNLLDVTVVNTKSDALGFAYSYCPEGMGNNLLYAQLRLNFSDTLTLQVETSAWKLVLFQFKEYEDGSGIGLAEQQIVYPREFFGIY